jgi:hypothetical protein
MYMTPMMTPNRIVDICMNPDSQWLFRQIEKKHSCKEWYTAEIFNEEITKNVTT